MFTFVPTYLIRFYPYVINAQSTDLLIENLEDAQRYWDILNRDFEMLTPRPTQTTSQS